MPVILVGMLLVLALGAVALALIELANDDQQVAQAPPARPRRRRPPPRRRTGEQPAPGEAGATRHDRCPRPPTASTAAGQSGDRQHPRERGRLHGQRHRPPARQQPQRHRRSAGTGTIAAWPSGKTAWTVILESATSKSAAEQKANELSSGGTSVGVLHSDDYSSLNPGYWVVFSGQYDSQSAAESALSGLSRRSPRPTYVTSCRAERRA